MADADKIVEILIRFGLSKEKAEEARAELGKLRESTNELAGQTTKLAEAQEGAEKSAGKLKDGHKELHKLMELMSSQSPVLGTALRAFLSPIGAGLTTAILLFRAVKTDIEETERKLNEMGSAAARELGDLSTNLVQAREQVVRNKEEYEKWRTALIEGVSGVERQLDDQLKKIDATMQAEIKLAQVRFSLQKVRIETDSTLSEDEKRRQLAGLEAAQREFETRKQGQSAAEQEKTISAALAAEQKRLAESKTQLDTAASAAADPKRLALEQTQRTQLEDALAARKSARDARDQRTPEAAAREEKEIAVLREKLGYAQQAATAPGPESMRRMYAGHVKQYEAEIANAVAALPETRIAAADKEIAQLQKQLAAHKDINATLQERQAEYEKHFNEVDRLTRQLDTLKGNARADAEAFAAAEPMRRAEAGLGTGSGRLAGSEIGWGMDVARRLGAGGRAAAGVTGADRSRLTQLGSAIAGQPVNLETAETMLQRAQQSEQVYANYVIRLIAVVERLVHQGNNPDLERRLRALEYKGSVQRTAGGID